MLRLPPRWTRITYPIVVLFLLAGVYWIAFGEVRRQARGPAAVRIDEDGRILLVALLPSESAAELRRGALVRAELTGETSRSFQVLLDFIDERPMEPCDALHVLGPAGTHVVPPSSRVVLIRAHGSRDALGTETLDRELHEAVAATVEVQLRAERPVFAFFPGLRAALGG